MTYKKSVEAIQKLDWKSFDPLSIIFVSLFTAEEFASSLRTALQVFPTSNELKLMADGELQTNNLQYGDYARVGDHWQFLAYFLFEKADAAVRPQVYNARSSYSMSVGSLFAEQKAMTIFSRERELPGIFQEILAAHEWERLGFGYYEYYLKRHIELDTEEGGHADLTKKIKVGRKLFRLKTSVLSGFWAARLKLYQDALVPRRPLA